MFALLLLCKAHLNKINNTTTCCCKVLVMPSLHDTTNQHVEWEECANKQGSSGVKEREGERLVLFIVPQ